MILSNKFTAFISSRVGNPLDWRGLARCQILTINAILFFGFLALLTTVSTTKLLATGYLDASILGHLSTFSLVCTAIWVVIFFVSMRLVKLNVTSVALVHGIFQFGALSFSIVAYLIGPFTSPILLIFLLFIASLALFDWRPVLFGLLTAGVIILGTTVASQLELIRYAPLFSESPVRDGKLSLFWVVVAGGTSLIFLSNLLFVFGYLVQRWKERDAQLRRMSITDELTQVANRRHIMHGFDSKFAQAEADEAALTCVMIDIDHFKKINDNYGHQAGDKVLIEVAALLRKQLRRRDMIGRYGGEEFMILLPQTGVTGARALAERCRDVIASTPIVVADDELRVTISVGVANHPMTGAQDGPELIRHADDALYRSKNDGRNRVTFFSKDDHHASY